VEKLDADRIAVTPSQPIPRRTSSQVRIVGVVRIPLAGPYRPLARLYRFPDGRLLWRLRLWEVDRPVDHLVRPEVLRAYARRSGLPTVVAALDALVDSARSGPHGGRD
jgi:hypothetical protein